ncbi:MAG: hypothetical protein MUP98_06145 [Candidatus Aminicenantes bacterium]|nr:hypothetical protein [Candidatus Aminicenantes bacterium]
MNLKLSDKGKMMFYKEIKVKKILYAFILKKDFSKHGLTFLTPDSYALQLGFWHLDDGTRLKSHICNQKKIIIERTQELIHVLAGSLKVSIYKENGELIESFIAKNGDTVFHAKGEHGYEILEKGTKVIEIKNGPFKKEKTDKSVNGLSLCL